MTKANQRKSKTRPAKPTKAEELPEDMYDEIDDFHRGADKVSLEPRLQEDSGADLEDEDEAVYNLGGEGSDFDDSDESEVEDEMAPSKGRLADLAKQEKLMRAQLQLHEGGKEDGSDEEDEEDEGQERWGARKGAYYASAEADDDEEGALEEEEEEALRMQREQAAALRPEDFGQDSDLGTSGDEEEDTIGNLIQQGTSGRVEIEEVAREPITSDQQEAAIRADAPELEDLLGNLRNGLDEVRSVVAPLLKEVREGQLATAEGVSYLEVKNLLLLHYCLHLVFYLMLKAEGKPVRQHPVIARLVEIRAFLERVRPIDKKLRYQLEKLLKAAQAVQANGKEQELADDPLRFRPNPEALVPKMGAGDGDGAGKAGTGVYRPPRLNPVAMEEDPDKDYGKKERRRSENQARRSGRSQIVRELAQEIAGAPEELRDIKLGEETAGAAAQLARLEQRAAEEEDLMIRVPLSKQERRQLKANRRAGMSGGAMLDDFADEVADLVQVTTKMDAGFMGGRVSQKYGADLSQAATDAGRRSGDADLPAKPALADRRARLDNVRAKQAMARFEDEDDEGQVPGEEKRRRGAAAEDVEDDPLYQAAASKSRGKKAARAEKYSAPSLPPPLEDEMADGPRKVSRVVEQNRGLTPHRRKDTKNPRVKGRKRFEKANIRRKGQVTAVKTAPGPYGGEQTGIKSRVTKSTRF